MSHYGSPPDPNQPDPNQPDPSQPGQVPPAAAPYGGSHAAAPDPYAQQGSSYGEPSPYGGSPQGGQSAPYVQPPQAVNPYAGPDNGKPTFVFAGYASWGSRAVAYIIDYVLALLAGFPALIGEYLYFTNYTTTTLPDGAKTIQFHWTGASALLLLIGAVTGLIFFVWNQCLRQGRTGATLGKSIMAIRVVHADMQPIGGGLSFVRYLADIVNSLACYLGWLWPLWDERHQTLADKIMSTYVIQAVEPQPRVY